MSKLYTFQVYDSKRYGGEAREITKYMTENEASDYAAYLKNCCGWTSVCWGVQ